MNLREQLQAAAEFELGMLETNKPFTWAAIRGGPNSEQVKIIITIGRKVTHCLMPKGANPEIFAHQVRLKVLELTK